VENLSDYTYDLPKSLIAQIPAEQRSRSRLLVLDRGKGGADHARFDDLPSWLRPGDAVVLNDTRVIPARIEAKRLSGGKVELFLLEPDSAGIPSKRPGQDLPLGVCWRILAKPSGRLKEGETLELVRGGRVSLLCFCGGGEWRAFFEGVEKEQDLFGKGRMPLPHYIERERGADPRDRLDRERYQTIYASKDGAVAAPTAGLHFTKDLLDRVEAAGAGIHRLTLHVGIGTFAPVRDGDIRRHVMHEERYEISAETASALNEARSSGGRIVAVGTTSARVLETVARDDGSIEAGAGWTGIYIYPPYRFKAVDALVTNFHLPRSTLLLLVSAFASREMILAAYEDAVEKGYRFYSYGDAMLIV